MWFYERRRIANRRQLRKVQMVINVLSQHLFFCQPYIGLSDMILGHWPLASWWTFCVCMYVCVCLFVYRDIASDLVTKEKRTKNHIFVLEGIEELHFLDKSISSNDYHSKKNTTIHFLWGNRNQNIIELVGVQRSATPALMILLVALRRNHNYRFWLESIHDISSIAIALIHIKSVHVM